MTSIPKPVVRGGVKGHIITVEEHKKFVPNTYDKDGKKKR
jgi:hypothetical protein